MTETKLSEQAAFTLKSTHDRSRAMTWDHDSNGKQSEQDYAAHAAEADETNLSFAELDVELYIAELVDFEFSDEEKSEYLHLIWDIMKSLVNMRMPSEAWKPVLGAVIYDPHGPGGSNNPSAPCEE